MKQESLNVTDYYTNLKVLWDEMMVLRPIPKCSCDPQCSCGLYTTMKGYMEADFIIRFLKGLNDVFSAVKS